MKGELRRSQRAMTLVEVMVVTAVFGLLSLVVVLSFQGSRDSERRHDAQSQTQRAGLVALAKLRADLRGARVVIPSNGNQHTLLRYRRPQLGSDGNVLVDPQGEPLWEAPSTVSLQADGKLTVNGPEPRVLGDLFDRGEIRFQRTAQTVLEIDVTAAQSSPDVSSRVVTRVEVPNS